MKLVHLFFSSWNWFYSRNLLLGDFVRVTCCMMIFLFVKLVHCFFCFRNWFCWWNLLRVDVYWWNFILSLNLLRDDFCSGNLLSTDLFYSWNLFYIDFSLRETWTLIYLLMKLILFFELVAWWFLFLELVACWFVFMKLVVCWFFSSWYLFIDFFPRETNLVPGSCCMLIFAPGTCYVVTLFMKHVVYWFFSSWNLYVDFPPCEIDFVQRICCMLIFFSWNMSHADFFSSWNMYIDFSPRSTQFAHGPCCMLTFLVVLVVIWFLFVKVFACWFFSLWKFILIFLLVKLNKKVHETYCMLTFVRGICCLQIVCSWNFLHVNFSPRETDFVHGTCCVLIFLRRTCCLPVFLWNLLDVDFSLCETFTLVFLFLELILF